MKTPDIRNMVPVVTIICRRCGATIGPLPLDGKPYTCKECDWLIFSTDDEKTKRMRMLRNAFPYKGSNCPRPRND